MSATVGLMRNINRSAILELIRKESPITRSKIARCLNVSFPTVVRIVDDLMEEGLIKSSDAYEESTGGRPPELLEFNGQAHAVVGIDLSGTKILGAVSDLSGNIQEERQIAHKEGASPEYHLAHLCEVIDALLASPRPADQEVRGIGVGAPGVTLVPNGVVTWAPSFGWRDLPLQDILNERFDVPVFVENDVNLAALGELGFGCDHRVTNLVSIAVGTGIGAGIIIDGALYRGHNQGAGEVCYMLPGVEFLGRRYDEFGALESLASVTGIVKRAKEICALEEANGVENITVEDVFEAAREGVPWAQKVIDDTVDYLSLAIVNISTTLDPEIIILGGEVTGSSDLLIEAIRQRLEGIVPFVPQVVASSLGPRAVVMGAIMLVLNMTTDYFTIRQLP